MDKETNDLVSLRILLSVKVLAHQVPFSVISMLMFFSLLLTKSFQGMLTIFFLLMLML